MNTENIEDLGRRQDNTVDPRSPSIINHPYNKTITMATIAKAAGVSQGAISSLLNDRDYGIRVSEKTRKRVFKACRDLGYIPNDLRAVVRMYPELGDLCLLVSNSLADWASQPFHARILKGAASAIPNPPRYITLAEYDEKADFMENPDLLPYPVRSGTASKFLCVGAVNFSLFQALLKRDLPVTFLGGGVAISGITTIQPDYVQASQLAIDHLLKGGHRRIAILSGPFGSEDHAVSELNRGIRRSYENSGIPFEAQNIIHSDLTFESGVSAIDVLFSRSQKPTAIFCLSDESASGAMTQSQRLGNKVPENLSIIGCADNPVAGSIGLTTVHLPAEEMGAEALKDVQDRVQSGKPLDSRNIVVPARLIERNSFASVGL
jgi:DNA-binding LacI/PurR family transcriptional regulator